MILTYEYSKIRLHSGLTTIRYASIRMSLYLYMTDDWKHNAIVLIIDKSTSQHVSRAVSDGDFRSWESMHLSAKK